MENLYVSIQGSRFNDCVSKILSVANVPPQLSNVVTCWEAGLEIYSSVTQLGMDRIWRYFTNFAKLGQAHYSSVYARIIRVLELTRLGECSHGLCKFALNPTKYVNSPLKYGLHSYLLIFGCEIGGF